MFRYSVTQARLDHIAKDVFKFRGDNLYGLGYAAMTGPHHKGKSWQAV